MEIFIYFIVEAFVVSKSLQFMFEMMCVEVILDIVCWIVVCEDFYLVFIFVRLCERGGGHCLKKLIETSLFTIDTFHMIVEAFVANCTGD